MMNNITQEEQERIKQTIYKLLGTDKPTYDDFINNKSIILSYIDGYIEGKLYNTPDCSTFIKNKCTKFLQDFLDERKERRKFHVL